MEVDRNSYVGGADAPIICGVSEYCTPYELYRIKVGESKPAEENLKMRLGKYLESFILDEFKRQTGFHTILNDELLNPVNPVSDALKGTPDGFCYDSDLKKCLIEIKTSFSRYADCSEPYLAHKIQVQYYLWLTGLHTCYLIYLYHGELSYHVIQADAKSQEYIVKKMLEFWNRVTLRIPPEPTTIDDCKSYYNDEGSILQADSDLVRLINDYAQLRNSIECYESDLLALKTDIIKAIGNNSVVKNQNKVVCTYKADKNNRRSLKVYGE